jgi:hypothetical protein
MDWSTVAQDMDKWLALMNKATDLGLHKKGVAE